MLIAPQSSEVHRGADRRIVRILIGGAKLLVTGACFFYLARRIDFAEISRTARNINIGWAALAVLAIMLQIPLAGWRWWVIVDTLERGREPVRRAPALAITAISTFFGQIVPNVAAETVRVWMLTRLGPGWRRAVAGVILDRAVGIVVLAAIGLVILLFPSPFADLAGHRLMVIGVFAAILVGAIASLTLANQLARLFERWRLTRWAGKLAAAGSSVFLGSGAGPVIIGIALAIHGLSILAIWLLGLAAHVPLTPADAAVLFTVMLGISLFPVSISGWGVRELAVTTLLSEQGIPLEQSLLFSLSFGFAILIAALPGAVIWATYSPGRSMGA